MIFYFTATGNSLYAARQLDSELISIPKEMAKKDRHYKADKIGIVCPLFEFEMPPLIKEFIRDSVFETDYFYIVVTYGCHHGGVAIRTQEFLSSIGKPADYINTVIMHDNAIIVFDMDQQRSIEEEKQVDKHLSEIKADIDSRKKMVQEPSKEELDFYNGFMRWTAENGPMYTFPLYKVTDKCVGCGTCVNICPKGAVSLKEGKPVFDDLKCMNCMACIQACPTKALQFASVKEPNPNSRYKNPHVSLNDIIESNKQL
ncbi:MAG: EFR1 family ferrodoxin [Lachnospiraceae bacterium]|nr:EFR1 family ferrodoxin [Lachnospiraceae bacterium]